MTTRHQQPAHVIITALKLILVTIECGGHHLECSYQLCELVGDQLCYHLFMVCYYGNNHINITNTLQLLSQTRSVPVFSLVIRNCCLLFHAARHLLKLQFEVWLNFLLGIFACCYWLQMFLNKLMDVVSMEHSLLYIKELALECFLQVLLCFCHVISCDHYMYSYFQSQTYQQNCMSTMTVHCIAQTVLRTLSNFFPRYIHVLTIIV